LIARVLALNIHSYLPFLSPQVLAFARTNGEQGRKRVPFTSFAKQKKAPAKAMTTRSGQRRQQRA
jgi:hypothetical protein